MAAAELAEASTDRAGFWATRPSKAWSLAGLIGMIAALGVGILIGRAQGGDGDRGRVAPTVAPPTPTPTAEKAPVAAAGPSASAPAESPAKAGPAVKHASATFDAQAAKLAIDRMLPRLKDCKRPGEPPGSATVTVTFAPSGRVSEAAVTTTRYAGTRTGKCIEAHLRALRIAEFTGKPVTVKRVIAVR